MAFPPHLAADPSPLAFPLGPWHTAKGQGHGRAMKDHDSTDVTADLLLHAYTAGIFPMSENRNDPEVFWV
jgi:hypothetical protein